jgi:hypothetical protein
MSFEPVTAPRGQEVRPDSARATLIPTETVIERETIRDGAHLPGPAAEAPELNVAGIEADVLARLMPALDAWYGSDTSSAPVTPASPAVPPTISPLRRDTEPATIVQTPQLVIGSISVEVVATPAAAPAAAPRPRAIPAPAREPHSFPSRAGLGLGQI